MTMNGHPHPGQPVAEQVQVRLPPVPNLAAADVVMGNIDGGDVVVNLNTLLGIIALRLTPTDAQAIGQHLYNFGRIGASHLTVPGDTARTMGPPPPPEGMPDEPPPGR